MQINFTIQGKQRLFGAASHPDRRTWHANEQPWIRPMRGYCRFWCTQRSVSGDAPINCLSSENQAVPGKDATGWLFFTTAQVAHSYKKAGALIFRKWLPIKLLLNREFSSLKEERAIMASAEICVQERNPVVDQVSSTGIFSDFRRIST